MANQSTDLTLKLDGAKEFKLRDHNDFDEALRWINDSSRPGRYSYERGFMYDWHFRISDPNVALEFKMRWC